jgi:hypothetical protein
MELYDWIIAFALLFALVFSLYLFFITPKNKRTLQLEKKRKVYPKSAEAVLIRSDKLKAIKANLPIIIYFTMVGFLGIYTTRIIENPFCESIFGINAGLIMYFIMYYALPFGLFLYTLSLVKDGIKTLKTGYFPPLDSIRFHDTIATKSIFSKIKGLTSIALPFLAFFILGYTHSSFMNLTKNEPIKSFHKLYKKKCFSDLNDTE